MAVVLAYFDFEASCFTIHRVPELTFHFTIDETQTKS